MARQDAADIAEWIADMHPHTVDGEFTYILVVLGTAHLEDCYPASHSAIHLDITQQYDRVGGGGDMGFGNGRSSELRRRGGGEEAGYLLMLDGGNEADDELPEPFSVVIRSNAEMLSTAIRAGRNSWIALFILDQMIFQAHDLGIFANYPQQSLLFQLIKINPNVAYVAEQLLAALFEGEKQSPFSFSQAACEEFRGDHGLAGTGVAGDKNDGIPEEASMTHLIQFGVPRGDSNVG